MEHGNHDKDWNILNLMRDCRHCQRATRWHRKFSIRSTQSVRSVPAPGAHEGARRGPVP
jgi:hypothetical protein